MEFRNENEEDEGVWIDEDQAVEFVKDIDLKLFGHRLLDSSSQNKSNFLLGSNLLHECVPVKYALAGREPI